MAPMVRPIPRQVSAKCGNIGRMHSAEIDPDLVECGPHPAGVVVKVAPKSLTDFHRGRPEVFRRARTRFGQTLRDIDPMWPDVGNNSGHVLRQCLEPSCRNHDRPMPRAKAERAAHNFAIAAWFWSFRFGAIHMPPTHVPPNWRVWDTLAKSGSKWATFGRPRPNLVPADRSWGRERRKRGTTHRNDRAWHFPSEAFDDKCRFKILQK